MGTELRHMLASEVDGARIHAGVSFPELADLSGIDLARLVDLLEGEADFTVVDLADIAAALDLPVTALLPASAPDDC